MEEILSSIRRIIADEENETAKPEGAAAAGEGPTRPDAGAGTEDPLDNEDVLDLTRKIDEDGELVDLDVDGGGVPAADGTAGEEVVLEAELQPESLPEGAVAPALAAAAPHPSTPRERPQLQEKDQPNVAASPHNSSALLDESAADAATSAFARFAHTVVPTPADQRVASSDGRTLEEFAEDILRPMLKEWLDQHLPGIVEQVVEREIHKLARRAELL